MSIDIRTSRRAVGWNVQTDIVTVRVPRSDHCDTVAKFHNTDALGCLGILDPDLAAWKSMAMWERKSHQPTCSTDKDPLGSGLINSLAETEGSSQSTHVSRSRMTICRS
jgi:hypothetical protein